MLDINYIRANPKIVKQGAQSKGVSIDVEKLLKVDKKRRRFIQQVEDLRAKQNEMSQKKPKPKEIKKLQKMKKQIKKLEDDLQKVQKRYQALMRQIPNIPFEEVPVGKNDEENIVLRKVGKKTKPKTDYLKIAKKLDLIDMQRAAKVSGSRFAYLKGDLALIQFALINFVFRKLTDKGFKPVIPPVLVKKNAMKAMGYWEHGGQEEIYYLPKDDLCLVGTSEQSLGPMHKGEMLNKKNLPLRYAGFSSCFRREAGSYGKDTRGIFRVHQFDKIEMFSFCHPQESKKEHELILEIEEELMQDLELPYQVVHLCTGDLGTSSAMTYDIEAWMPGQDKYRETHSCSNCTDFQARRLNIRWAPGKYVHTLNGTAIAMGRTLIAIIENYQTKDGSIRVPKVLQKYTGFKKITASKR